MDAYRFWNRPHCQCDLNDPHLSEPKPSRTLGGAIRRSEKEIRPTTIVSAATK